MGRFPELQSSLSRDFRNSYNEGIKKIDLAVSKSESEATSAYAKSVKAESDSTAAKNTANQVKEQLNNIILENGDSTPEVVAMRTDSNGYTFPTAGERLNELNNQVVENVSKFEKSAVLYSKELLNIRKDLGIKICCMGTSMTYGTDTTSTDKRAPDITPTDNGSLHTATRASVSYPEALSEYLNTIYNGNVVVVNKGYSGDGTKKGYEHWNASGADICIMDYGINDASNDSIEYVGDVEVFLYWYRKLIQRELDNGTSVILLTPTKQRIAGATDIDGRTAVSVYANAVKMLAKEFNIPYIDGWEILKNYSSDIYSDYTHLNGKGYRILGARLASVIVGKGANEPCKVSDGDFIGIRPQVDSLKLTGSSIVSSTGYPTPNEGESGKGVSGLIKNGQKITWSFYAEEDGLVVIPGLYTVDPNPVIKFELDFNMEQAQWGNTWSYFQDTVTNHAYREPASFSLAKSDLVALNGTAYSSAIVRSTDQKALKIVGKGWHTITLSVQLSIDSNSCTVHGLEFFSLNNYRNRVYKKIPVTLTNAEAYDAARTPYLIIKNNGDASLIGTIKNATISNTIDFGNIDAKYAPKQNMVFVVSLSSSTGGGYGVVLVTPSGKLMLCFVSSSVTYANLHGVGWSIGE